MDGESVDARKDIRCQFVNEYEYHKISDPCFLKIVSELMNQCSIHFSLQPLHLAAI